ncbi:MAG: hypothetical protein JWQ07_4037 [Ramlibacter sp.]|nr:hypothetical protein [Ramlibacter sp.]
MSNGRNKVGKRNRHTWDGYEFALIPHVVIDSAAYMQLTWQARALLVELARQFTGHNNGKLLLTRKYMEVRGWYSAGQVAKAKSQLETLGFIHETVKGCRPNKASWYALTWQPLAPDTAYDAGAFNLFRRGAYRDMNQQSTALIPADRAKRRESAPPRGPVPKSLTRHAEQ